MGFEKGELIMKKILLSMLLLAFFIPTISMAESLDKIRVSALAGNVGLAMVKMMDRPTNFSFEIFKTPDLAVGKLIAGETDIAGLPTSTAAVMYNKGVGIQVAAIIGWGVMYIVSNDSTIKKWTDLKGKEIYVSAKGAISDILLRYLITKNGLNPEQDVQIQYIASSVEIAQLVASGKVTLAAMPEPWVTEVLEKNPQLKVVLDYQKEWQRVEKQGVTYPQTCIVVRKKFAEEHPVALRNFLKELDKSIQWVNQNPKDAGVLAEKYVQIAPIAVEKGLVRTNLKYNEAFKVRPEIDRFLQRLVEFAPESVGGKVPDEGFYNQP
jgi:NitT/TauT family transport system substrate-binding protein